MFLCTFHFQFHGNSISALCSCCGFNESNIFSFLKVKDVIQLPVFKLVQKKVAMLTKSDAVM